QCRVYSREVLEYATDLYVDNVGRNFRFRIVLGDLLPVSEPAHERALPVAGTHGRLGAADRGVDVDVGVLHEVQRDAAAEARVDVTDADLYGLPFLREVPLLEQDVRVLPRRVDGGIEDLALDHFLVVEVVAVRPERDLVDLRCERKVLRARDKEVEPVHLLEV